MHNQTPMCDPLPVPPTQNIIPPAIDLSSLLCKCPACTIGLTSTNAAFLVPDHIQKKFVNGWNVHVPLTFLMDNGHLLKDRHAVDSTQDVLLIDNNTSHIVTTSKPLLDDGELDLTFNEWHQVWHWLLELIRTFLPDKFPLWEVHHTFILNRDNHSELWPLYPAYDAEIHRRAIQFLINPSMFSISIWNDLEMCYTARKVLSMVQSDMILHSSSNNHANPTCTHNPSKAYSSQSHQHSPPDSTKTQNITLPHHLLSWSIPECPVPVCSCFVLVHSKIIPGLFPHHS